jgi:hypothetical protein
MLKRTLYKLNISLHHTWLGYEVPGMILLSDLEGIMQLDHSKDMAVHFATFASYNFNTLRPVGWKLWR